MNICHKCGKSIGGAKNHRCDSTSTPESVPDEPRRRSRYLLTTEVDLLRAWGLRQVYWRTPETAEWIDLNDAIAYLLRQHGGIHTDRPVPPSPAPQADGWTEEASYEAGVQLANEMADLGIWGKPSQPDRTLGEAFTRVAKHLGLAAPSAPVASPAPQADRADLIERLYDANGFDDITYHEAEVRGLLTEAADALAAPSAPVERPRPAITAEMLRAAETHHGDSCSYCTSAGDIDCPTAAILDALTPAPTDGAPVERPQPDGEWPPGCSPGRASMGGGA